MAAPTRNREGDGTWVVDLSATARKEGGGCGAARAKFTPDALRLARRPKHVAKGAAGRRRKGWAFGDGADGIRPRRRPCHAAAGHAMPPAAVTEEPLFCFYKNHATSDRG
jgi:hypothetical protein